MTSSRPYILRALYEWINDNRLTPYIIINVNKPDVFVPREYINDGRIVFNISPDAIFGLEITNSQLQFDATFSGMSRHISTPIEAIEAIYAQENGQGMFFGDEPGGDSPPDDSKFTKTPTTVKKPHLKVVKESD